MSVPQLTNATNRPSAFTAGVPCHGRHVVFASGSPTVVDNDINGAQMDVVPRDVVSGTTVLVSVALGNVSGNGGSDNPAMSSDGRVVAFISAASNLAPGDNNGSRPD